MQLIQAFQTFAGSDVKYQSPGAPRVHIFAAKNAVEKWIFSVQANRLNMNAIGG
jgi:hypothetical protein